MIRWDRNKHEINNGYEFEPGDDANVEQINGTINNALYAVDVADGLTEAPVVENPNPEEAPTVSFVDYQKDIDGVMKTVKKFKFTNIKGKRGEKGEKGDKGDSALTFQIGTVTTLPAGSEATVKNAGTNQDVVLDFGLPKGDLHYEYISKIINIGVLQHKNIFGNDPGVLNFMIISNPQKLLEFTRNRVGKIHASLVIPGDPNFAEGFPEGKHIVVNVEIIFRDLYCTVTIICGDKYFASDTMHSGMPSVYDLTKIDSGVPSTTTYAFYAQTSRLNFILYIRHPGWGDSFRIVGNPIFSTSTFALLENTPE